eukprot:scaffold1068_cov167-Amphora_coffeaeformis.AAC.25
MMRSRAPASRERNDDVDTGRNEHSDEAVVCPHRVIFNGKKFPKKRLGEGRAHSRPFSVAFRMTRGLIAGIPIFPLS